jgi:hypothetical protein
MLLIQLFLMETQHITENFLQKGLKVLLLPEDKKIPINLPHFLYKAAQPIKINILPNKFSLIVISLRVLKNTLPMLPNFRGKAGIAK